MKTKSVVISLMVAFVLLMGLRQIAMGQSSSAEGPIWQTVGDGFVPAAAEGTIEGGDKPVSAHYIEMNAAALEQRLAEVPLEDFSIAAQAGLTVSLPLPEGDFGVFELLESPIMEQGLADRYPDFKSYVGYGVDDETAVTRITFTPFGFSAMIISQRGTIFIKPVQDEDGRYYQSYYKHDVPLPIQAFIDRHVGPSHSMNTVTEVDMLTGDELRTYRIAVATTGEFYQNNGGSDAAVLAVVMSVVNNARLIYEQEAAVRLLLIANNDLLLFNNPATDPYTGSLMLEANQATIDTVIGSANYDIGHLFAHNGNGGVAGVGNVCGATKARGRTSTDGATNAYFEEVFWHETGHQFGANHTWNSSSGGCVPGQYSASTAYEPGSGTTVMSYASLCSPDTIQSFHDPFFHSVTFDEVVNFTTVGAGNSCALVEALVNTPPVANAGTGGFTIPYQTPFTLSGSGSDGDGDSLTYSWEQFNLGPAGSPNSPVGDAPIFRSFPPTTDPSRTFPQLSDILVGTQTLGELLPTYDRTLTFRLTVRDGRRGVDYDQMSFNVTSAAGPFQILFPNGGEVINPGASTIVTWSVASTNVAPVNCTNVNILRSLDGGQTFTAALSNTPNDGSAVINFPNITSSQARIKIECSNNIFFDISDADFTVLGNFVSINGAPCTYQSISDAVAAASSGDTIYVTPGSYFELVTINNKDLTIQPATSNCTTLAATGFVTINGDDTTRGMTIVDSDVTLRKVRVLNGFSGVGAGIHATNSNVTLDASILGPFNNTNGGGGGGIFLNGGILTMINDSNISYNEAGSGGGVFANGGAVVDLWDTSSIDGNEAAGGLGGGVYLEDASLIMRASSGINDNLASIDGGGIYMTNGSSLTTVGSPLINNNQAGSNGGGLYVNGGTVGIDDTVISNNRADDGGGIAATGGATINVQGDSTLLLNSALGTNSIGGGAYLNNANLDLRTDVTVVSNTAESGAGIYGITGATLDMFDNAEVFDNNTSGGLDQGGGIYFSGSSITMFSNARLLENSANEGGGVYLDNSTLSMWNTSNATGNSAENGAGIFAGNGSFVTVRDNAFLIFNETSGLVNTVGGAISLDSSSLNLWHFSIVRSNLARNGGGVHAVNGSTLVVSGNADIDNNATTTGGKGGGFYLQDSTMNQYNNSEIVENTADQGGGIYLDNTSLTMWNFSKVDENDAVQDGGGIYAANGSSILMRDSSDIGRPLGTARDGNSAGDDGGGAYLDGSTLSMSFTASMRSNSAQNDGGGVYLDGGTFTMSDNSQNENNIAITGSGGGAYATNGAVVTLWDSAVIGQTSNTGTPNQSNNGAGGIEITGATSSLTLNDSSLIAFNDGWRGAVYALSSATVTMNGSSAVRDNFDSSAGTFAAGINIANANLFVNGTAAIQDNLNGDGVKLQPGNATFMGGIVSGNDGLCGVDADSSSTITMDGTQITNQPSIGLCTDGIATIDNTTIEFNNIGVSVSGNAGTQLNMTGGSIASNSVKGIQMFGGQTVMTNVTIENNGPGSGCAGIDSGSNATLTLVDSLVQMNNSTGGNGGGICIRNSGSIQNSVVMSNTTDRDGGGIYLSSNVTLLVSDSQIIGNEADQGGGIYVGFMSSLDISNSTIENNEALVGNSLGGGIYIGSGEVNGQNLLINNNRAGDRGGGVFIGSGQFNLDSDFSSCDPKALPANTYCSELRDNVAGLNGTADGGAIHNLSGTADLGHTGLTNNSASGSGEAIYSGGAITLSHSIVRDNPTVGYGILVDNGSFFAHHSTITGNARSIYIDGGTADFQSSIVWGNAGNIVFANSPTLTAVCNNTQGSPLPGVGNISQDPLFVTNTWGDYHLDAASPSVDQCTLASTVDLINTIAPQGILADMGAFEAITPQIYYVNDEGSESDSFNGDGVCETSGGLCTFQAAVDEANARPVQDTIILPAGTFPSNNLLISEPVIIEGFRAGRTFLEGITRVLVTGVASRPNMLITISKVSIFRGNAVGINGGGIFNNSTLVLDNVYIWDNQARFGGGIYNSTNARLTVQNSTIATNTASWTFLGITSGSGGAIYNNSNFPVSIINSTISSNQAAVNGGGIHHAGSGDMILHHVTLVENSVTEPGSSGGGMANTGSGSFAIYHALVGNNTDVSGNGPDCFGSFENPLGVSNIVEDALSSGCTWDFTPTRTDPGVGPLGNNGGEAPTHPLLMGSIAIDLGVSAAWCLPTDQRGYPRVGNCDLGAYEYNATPTAITLSDVNIGSSPNGLMAIIGVVMMLLAGISLFAIKRGRE